MVFGLHWKKLGVEINFNSEIASKFHKFYTFISQYSPGNPFFVSVMGNSDIISVSLYIQFG